MTDLTRWEPREMPGREPIAGRFALVEPILDASRFAELWAAFAGAERLWRFLPYGPFASQGAFEGFARMAYPGSDPLFHAVVPLGSERAEGVVALGAIDPVNGVAEIGHLCFGPALRGTAAATEAPFLLMGRMFDALGYRRLEWRCDARDAASRRAAERLGFRLEGTLRRHMAVKGRNRDTALFALVDEDWPQARAGFEAWLRPENFGAGGRQRRSLRQCRRQP